MNPPISPSGIRLIALRTDVMKSQARGWPVAERGPRDGALTRSLDHPASRTSPAQSTHGWRVGHAEGQPTRRESQGWQP
jgi:hypothetical protein